jgi:GrpB-like predicted nucleotidyltransferase (UPF0157 family)
MEFASIRDTISGKSSIPAACKKVVIDVSRGSSTTLDTAVKIEEIVVSGLTSTHTTSSSSKEPLRITWDSKLVFPIPLIP